MTKMMTAKFPGTCTSCKATIAVGQAIVWTKGAGARHAFQTACDEAAKAKQIALVLAPAPVTVNLQPIATLLTTAREHGLKFPKVRFNTSLGALLLTLAGAQSKNPGAVYVKLNGEYRGLVAPDGAVRGPLATDDALLQALQAIGTDPAGAANTYGQMTGHCSFCGLELTDAGSIEVGYGPICAKHYGLPHTPKGTGKMVTLPEVA